MQQIDMPYYFSTTNDVSFDYDKDPETVFIFHIEGVKITFMEFDTGEKLAIGQSQRENSFVSSVPLDSSESKVMFSRNP